MEGRYGQNYSFYYKKVQKVWTSFETHALLPKQEEKNIFTGNLFAEKESLYRVYANPKSGWVTYRFGDTRKMISTDTLKGQ